MYFQENTEKRIFHFKKMYGNISEMHNYRSLYTREFHSPAMNRYNECILRYQR